ncbi:MAG: hypothetical protein ACYTEQ_19670 [Planctomycetota bacterium]|jgi:hypothetical protein
MKHLPGWYRPNKTDPENLATYQKWLNANEAEMLLCDAVLKQHGHPVPRWPLQRSDEGRAIWGPIDAEESNNE